MPNCPLAHMMNIVRSSGASWTPPNTDSILAVSGNNTYVAWTCFGNVLFTGSHDGGKTFANTMLLSSAPNTNPKTSVLNNDNVSISASGNSVAIMWDTNKTGGISNPVIRTSSDGGNTFGNIITLNSARRRAAGDSLV
jgi:hypothetical protein